MSPVDRVSEYPSSDGLDGIDFSDVIKGNADLEAQTTWSPPGEPERPTLPGHEHQESTPRFMPWLTGTAYVWGALGNLLIVPYAFLKITGGGA